MIVVHAVWSGRGRLCLWGEDATLPPTPPARAGRRPRVSAHPFAAAHETLAELLGDKGAAAQAELWLPTGTAPVAPVASPELVRDEVPPAPRRLEARAWSVPTVEYDPDDAYDRLVSLPGEVTAGAGLRMLVAVAGFACDLVTRGRLLPAIVGEEARWAPLITGSDADTLRALALALPPSVHAEVGGPPGAAAALAAMLDALTDAAARCALPSEPADRSTVASGSRGGPGRSGGPQGRSPGRSRGRSQGGPGAGSGSGADARGAAMVDPVELAAVFGPAAVVPRAKPVALPGVAGAWLAALTGRQRRFAAPAADRAALAHELAQWQRDAAGGAVRACFRLVEPAPAGDDAWRLDFALQSADEPSQVVEAEQVWQPGGAPGPRFARPQETLLGELGRASRLYPELETALRTARPAALRLDAAGAHRLLREGAPLLAAAGFGVLLPGWWNRPAARLGARLTARSAGSAPGTVAKDGGLGLDTLVDYRWELALGDQPLTAEELAGLAAQKTPLVRLRGQWVEIDPRRLAAGLRMITTQAELTVGDLLRLAGESEAPGGLPVVGIRGEGWLGDLLAADAERRLEPVAAPAGFTGTLRPYQERGLAWLHFLQSTGLGGILADDMGLGKTVQLLALIAGDAGRPAGEGTGPTLLVCPMSLVGNWQREAAKFAPGLRVHVHHGAERARGEAFARAVAAADLVITTYAIAGRDAEALSALHWRRLVVDEAQAIKNASTRQAVAVRRLPARHRIAVTGTPVENRLADLWSIMEFANPGLLGTAGSFKKRYAEPVERRGDDEAAARLRRLTQPFVLRRVKTDRSIITDLPAKLEIDVLCNLTAEQAALYRAVVDDMLDRIEHSEGIERRGLVLATMTKLKQVCNHPAQLLRDGSRLAGRSGKLERLEEILDEVLAAGEKALLFTQYAEFGGMLRGHLSARFGREVAFLHGGVAKADRDALVQRFQGDGPAAPPLFVLSLKAGGTGLTLTAANHVVHVDRWWNPAVEDQATDRAFRIGQQRSVQVRKFVCAGTVEEKIAAMIRDKRGLAARIVGAGEQWLTGLSTADLRELLTLDADAVVE